MANGDYGYFGKGDTGYAQYMTAFNRNFGGSSGGGGGGGNHNNGGGGGRAGAPRHGELRASDRNRLLIAVHTRVRIRRTCKERVGRNYRVSGI